MTKHYVSNRDVSVRIFKGDFFEWFSHVHPAVPHVIFIPVIGYMIYSSYVHGVQAGRIGLLFVAGMFLWTLTEYFVHRFIFHTTPEMEEEVRNTVSQLGPGEPALRKLAGLRQKHYFLAHGVHHDFPNDTKRLVMPPSLSIPLAVVFYVAFRFLFGVGSGPGLFAGFVFGYVIYDTIHYAVHHFSLHGRILLYLKKHHFRHHYQDCRKDFGVSSPLWDVVLGTLGGTGKRGVVL
jgi:hypothetical protein